MKRREFLKTALAGSGALLLPGSVAARFQPRGGDPRPIRLGIIGTGSRGRHLMSRFLRVPGVSIEVLCDIYPPSIQQAREVTRAETPSSDDYRRLLDRDDLDAVVVATPLHLHREHMVACLDAALPVYGEKAMGFTVEDNLDIVAAVERSGQIFQVGHQYRYAPWYNQAVDRIRSGEIGRVTHIYAYWHRNYDWRRPVPSPEFERLINWRLYREYSGGLLAELGSHHIETANWIFEATPEVVTGTGGITFYDDGRDVNDNVQALYTYPGGRRLFFSSIIGNHRMGFQIQVFGTGGGVELTLSDGQFFYEPARQNSAVPEAFFENGIETSPSLSSSGDMPYRGTGEPIEVADPIEPDLASCADFIACLREGRRPVADERVGRDSGIAVALGNQAIRTGQPVTFPTTTTARRVTGA